MAAPSRALRFLFVGGGTGGHLAPALGLAERLLERGHEVFFLTSGRAVERDYLPASAGHRSLDVDRSRLPRRLALLPALLRARRQAKAFRPDLVVGLGGLTGAAALGARRGCPLVLLEGNAVAGRGVRLLLPWAACVLTQFRETAASLPRGLWVGPLARRALEPRPRAEARRSFGLEEDRPVLLVTGGSQGAEDLNRLAARAAPALSREGWQLLAATGAGRGRGLAAACREAGLRATLQENLADMGAALSAAELALCRGGAATVGELWLHRLPALVAPYPYHRDRQQEHNARRLGGGVRLLDARAEDALARLLEPVRDASQREAMRRALEATAPPDGRVRAVEILENLAAGRAGGGG